MKQRLLVLSIVCFLAGSLYAENKLTLKIAQIDYNKAFNTLGSQRIALLQLDPDIKFEISRLRAKMDSLLVEVIKAKDEMKLQTLENEQKIIQKKLSTIKKIAGNSQHYSESKSLIRKHVIENYTPEYALIIDSQFLRNSSNKLILSSGVKVEDITDKVIKDFEKILP